MPSKLSSFLRHPLFLCSLSFSCCFLLALLLALPLQPFSRQIEKMAQQQGLEVQIENPQLGLPFKLNIDAISIQNPQFPQRPINLSDISLTPLWTTMFGDAPGFSYQLKLWQGEVTGEAFRDGRVHADLKQLKINERLSPQLPLMLTGRLTKGNFSGTLPIVQGNKSQLAVSFGDLQLGGLTKLGSSDDVLPLSQFECRAEADGTRLSIVRCEGTGPALNLQATGQIRIGQTPAATSLNLTITLSPQASLDPFLKEMLSLVKKPLKDGRIQFRLTGSLLNPRTR